MKQRVASQLDANGSLDSGVGIFAWAVFIAAFVIRLLVRLAYGEDYFWKNSYSLFYELAQNVASGHGLSYEWFGTKWAQRPPVYPLFLALSVLGGKPFITIVVLQSLIGAGTALCAFLIGRELFDRHTGLLAAAGIAVYPYFVMHDTALQETGIFTFLSAAAVLLLLRSNRRNSNLGIWAGAGVALAAAVLTRATLLVFVPLALLWVLLFTGGTWQASAKKLGAVTLGLFLLVAPWLLRNYLVVGKPTFSTLTGLTLWAGNNPYTFSRYPSESIDRSVDVASEHLLPEEQNELKRLSTDEVAQNSWFLAKGLDYVRAHPAETIMRAPVKVIAAFSWKQNPRPDRFAQTVYFLSYFPILILGLVGMFLTRHQWKELSLIYALFFSFIVVTGIFFAHTSHRSYLDVYLMIFSAQTLVIWYQWWQQRSQVHAQGAS